MAPEAHSHRLDAVTYLNMLTKRFIGSCISLLIILAIYFGWACFVPNVSDPYYDLGRIFYYSVLVPIAAAGLLLSIFFGFIRYRQASNVELFIYTLLFISSFITIVPPLFLVARYLALPLASDDPLSTSNIGFSPYRMPSSFNNV
jgi:hypothetical protein